MNWFLVVPHIVLDYQYLYNEKLQIKDKTGKNIISDFWHSTSKSEKWSKKKGPSPLLCSLPSEAAPCGYQQEPMPTDFRMVQPMESSSRRPERGGREGAVRVLKIPSLYGCHLAGCALGNDRSSLDGLSHTNPSWVLALTLWIQRGLVLYYLRSITTPVISMYLCQDNFIQHPPTCPTMREPLKILLIININ